MTMRAVSILVFLALAPTQASGQDVIPVLDSIGPGCCTLRVTGIEGRAEGRFRGKPAPGRITLIPCKGNLCPPLGGTGTSVTVPPGARVEMYAGRAAGRGAFLGAAVGAAALTITWLAAPDLDISTGEAIAIGVPLGALGGAVVGAVIGAFFPRWKPVRQ
jgi:hypothetical protein